MNIKRLPARIKEITTLSPTAREVTLSLPEPLGFLPGAFVNVFLTKNGERMRRAYSISSDETNQQEITLSIRKGSSGGMSECFFDEGIEEVPIEIMGPLGLNTVNNITRPRIFLFGFGIGASVIKGLLPSLLRRQEAEHITIVTGSRSEAEIIYKEYFESCEKKDARLMTRFVVSQPSDATYPYQGYIQDHIADFDFRDGTVYLCGTKQACESLRSEIVRQTDHAPQFLLEAFD